MHERTLDILEFARIRTDVASSCLSPEGEDALRSFQPLSEPGEVRSLKEKCRAVRELFREGRGAPAGGFPPIEEACRTAAKPGTTLAIEELWALGAWSGAFGNLVAWIQAARDESIKAEAAAAPDLSPVAAIAGRIVGPDGEVRDIPELADIRKRIRGLHQDIEKTTESFLRDESLRPLLQNDVPTQRDGRTVLAVKAGAKHRIKGIIHEVSTTGQTVYVEPEALVRKNNELVEEEARYERELRRVLKEATDAIRGMLSSVAEARAACASLDGIFARARYSQAAGHEFAEESAHGIDLIAARHPILGSKAVPIDLRMPEGARTLIVTGPNTGGKTVALKTAGLLAAMNQFGLAVPARPGSALPVFDSVWADIGDEQSMDQSLSTFSGHMKAVSAIVAGATERSLVLLDELGSGTDPEEGCAIAMAILDRFIGVGAMTLATTHHGILKNYGYTKEGVLNASVDFDRDTLSPTYRILMGVPGESRALDIAARNGVDPGIVDGARRYLREERTDISALIAGLSMKHKELDSLRDEERRRLRGAIEEQRKADLKELKLRQREAELRNQGVGELKSLLSESRRTLENLVRALREGEISKDKTQAVKDFIAGLETKVEEEDRRAKDLSRRLKPGQGEPRELAPGMPVMVLPGRKRGRLLRKAKGGSWLVETDALRLTVDAADLEPAPEIEPGAPRISVEAGPRSSRATIELDIRGYRHAEAVGALERQLDAAIMEGLSGFSIIHGTGEGVLQVAVRETLSRYKVVTEFHYAAPEDGGHGKTVVRLV